MPTTTLVAPGEIPYVVVTDSSSYAAHFDMIAAIVGDQVLPPIVYSSKDRKTKQVKGINSQMLIDFIENILCPAINALDLSTKYLVLDKSNIHNISEIKQAFHNGLGKDSIQILIIPSQAAKQINPLDNALFHEWKERIRQHPLLTEETLVTTMKNEWFATTQRNIKHYYNHCGITRGRNVYNDCPFPSNHHHSS
jgi:hypothetical protein